MRGVDNSNNNNNIVIFRLKFTGLREKNSHDSHGSLISLGNRFVVIKGITQRACWTRVFFIYN